MKSTMTQLLERGMEKGKAEGIAEVAKVMLMEGDPISKIAKVTSLSEVEITKLKCEMDQD